MYTVYASFNANKYFFKNKSWGALHWVEAFLNDRQQRVVLDGCSSSTVSVDSGVLQCTVLGHTLSLIFTNDLPQCVNSSVRLFADDCVLYREISKDQDVIILQNDLRTLNHWEQHWLMEFTADKCFILNITRKRNPKLKKILPLQ